MSIFRLFYFSRDVSKCHEIYLNVDCADSYTYVFLTILVPASLDAQVRKLRAD